MKVFNRTFVFLLLASPAEKSGPGHKRRITKELGQFSFRGVLILVLFSFRLQGIGKWKVLESLAVSRIKVLG